MARNSFWLRGWNATLAAAWLAFVARVGVAESPPWYLIPWPFMLIFLLDGYYLWQERLFRRLYDRARQQETTDFAMDTSTLPRRRKILVGGLLLDNRALPRGDWRVARRHHPVAGGGLWVAGTERRLRGRCVILNVPDYSGGGVVMDAQSATISKETFQRFTLLYLIGQFPDGVFSSFRLQKVLYYATRDAEPKPFTFHHTIYGQYSRDAAAMLTLMLESDILKRVELTKAIGGVRWQVGDAIDLDEIDLFAQQGFAPLARAIRQSVQKYGFMKQTALDKLAHDDPILQENAPGSMLLKENLPDQVALAVDEDAAEDMDMLLSPHTVHFLTRETIPTT